MNKHTIMPIPACVCVESQTKSRGLSPSNTKTHEGAAMPPLGRGRCPRLAVASTTTTGTKKLVCSSSRPLWYHVVPEVSA